MNMINFKRQQNESDEELIFRVCSLKSTGTWQEIADGLNKELNTEYTESKFRKQYQAFQRMFDSVKHKVVDSNEHLLELEKKQDELYKQQVRTRDKLREYRKTQATESRIDGLIEVIESSILELPEIKINAKVKSIDNGNSAILKFSDLHIGKEINNYFNKYNTEIAICRVEKLISETVKYCKMYDVNTIYFGNLNDNIEGVLRNLSRVESNEDLVSQVMIASEIISKAIAELLHHGFNVKYISTFDNHSRSNINYREHVEFESFARLIDFYVKARLGNKIEYINNSIDGNLGYVQINGKNHFFAHGHLKAHALNSAIQNISIPLNMRVDYLHVGHWHSSQSKEYHFAKVYVNGSICGTDEYAMNNGWYSKPSQKLLIVENDNEVDININL